MKRLTIPCDRTDLSSWKAPPSLEELNLVGNDNLHTLPDLSSCENMKRLYFPSSGLKDLCRWRLPLSWDVSEYFKEVMNLNSGKASYTFNMKQHGDTLNDFIEAFKFDRRCALYRSIRTTCMWIIEEDSKKLSRDSVKNKLDGGDATISNKCGTDEKSRKKYPNLIKLDGETSWYYHNPAESEEATNQLEYVKPISFDEDKSIQDSIHVIEDDMAVSAPELVQDSVGDILFFSPQRRSGTSSLVNLLCGREVLTNKDDFVSEVECPAISVAKVAKSGPFSTLRLHDLSGPVSILSMY